MGDTEDATDDALPVPWQARESRPPPPELCLSIAWLWNEPHRAGQVARIAGPCTFGRAVGGAVQEDLVEFFEERPGERLAAAAIDCTSISRKQLLLEPVGERLVVQCVGRRELLHNGVPVTECAAAPGDTLMLQDAAVLLVESRAPVAARASDRPPGPFEFGRPDAQGIVGETPAAWRLRAELAECAASEAHVLVLGDSGAGKELAARAVHELSRRQRGPCIARNATTLPPSLIDAELFGSAKNYPNTGAPEREGLIGAVDGGTLFLDEIGDLPFEFQAHLLRILDSGGEYHRLGGSHPRRSDFRLVAATNRPLDSLKRDFLARFRVRIRVPGLSDRQGDIPLLIRELLARLAREVPSWAARYFDAGDARRARTEPRLIDGLLRHRYTLHTRELDRLLRLSATTSPSDYLALTAEVLEELDLRGGDAPGQPGVDRTRDEVVLALRMTHGNVSQAAERMGISRYALRRMVKRYGVEPER